MFTVDVIGPMSPNNYGYAGTPPGISGFPNYRPPVSTVHVQPQPAGNPNKHMVSSPQILQTINKQMFDWIGRSEMQSD